MTESIDFTSVPLFADFDAKKLETFLGAFSRRSLPAGHVLFEQGVAPSDFCLLVEGSLSVRDVDGERFLLKPVAPVGELGVITGEERKLSAVVAEPSVVLGIHLNELSAMLEREGDVSLLFHRNLLRLTARKIARDQRRQREMRENIVSTQKAMKRMQDALLEGEDSPLHMALFEQLDALIEQNKKSHYLVEPSRLVPTHVRVADGVRRVTAVSNEWLYFENPGAPVPPGTEWSGVVLLGDQELPLCGTVEKSSGSEVAVFLDEMIPEYDQALSEHLVRAQMLDVVL